MRPLALSLALLVLAGCADVATVSDTLRRSLPAPGASIPTDVPRTTWRTTYGEMQLSDLREGRVTAFYEGENGSLDGTLRGDVYSGIWVEPSSAQTCSTVQRGSDHWGRFEFTFDAARNSFDGVWSYCDGALTRGWDGTRR